MNFTEQEQDYYELILDMLDDGTIDESERALLNKRISKYGISDERAGTDSEMYYVGRCRHKFCTRTPERVLNLQRDYRNALSY